jgi:hypothetical protein
MRKLLIFLLLAAFGTSGCFWGERGRRRGEGPYRGDEYRAHGGGERHEGDRGHNDHGGGHDEGGHDHH